MCVPIQLNRFPVDFREKFWANSKCSRIIRYTFTRLAAGKYLWSGL